MADTENMIDIVELTARLGLPDHEQSAVAAFANVEDGHLWTEAEADELVGIWMASADMDALDEGHDLAEIKPEAQPGACSRRWVAEIERCPDCRRTAGEHSAYGPTEAECVSDGPCPVHPLISPATHRMIDKLETRRVAEIVTSADQA